VVNVSKSARRIVIRAETYQLVYDADDAWYIKLLGRNEKPVADLFIASSCDPVGARDECDFLGSPQLKRDLEAVELNFRGKSSFWREKEYIFRCADQELEYYYRLDGTGKIDNCRFFEGALRGDEKTRGYGPSHFVGGYQRPYKDFCHGSRAYFETLFNPEPNAREKQHFRFWEYAVINVRNDFSYHGGNWFLCPVPFCYALSPGSAKEWLTLGLAVRPNEYNFVDYQYQGGGEFGLNLTYQGYTQVSRAWESPHVVLLSADDEYVALEEYVRWLRNHGYIKFTRKKVTPWWRDPIFSGWGEQSVLAGAGDWEAVEEQCTFANYVEFLATLKSRGLHPGLVVVEGKWMDHYGNPRPDPVRWPDLRGFVDRQHREGRKVLLDFPLWRPEGLPRDECIVREDGTRLSPDPTNPKYQRRLERRLQEILTGGERGANADGLKLSRLFQTPSGPGAEMHGRYWGVELLYEHLRLIADIAKEYHSDALLMAPTANPYFAEVVDMVPLGSLLTDRLSVVERVQHRALVVHAAYPEWLLAVDDVSPPNLTAWRELWSSKPKVGTPCLHYVSRLGPQGEELEEQDYDLIRRVWADWRGQQG